MEDGYLGVSRLIALDPGGYGRLATDPDLERTFAEKIAKRWEEDRRFLEDPANLSGDVNAQRFASIWYGLEPERLNQVLANRTQLPLASPVDTLRAVVEWVSRSNPRQQAKAYLGLEARIFDSILAEGGQPPSETPAGLLLAVALTRLSTEAVFSRDLTREYHLPWPAQRGHSGPHIDGVAMMDAVFLDYSGDGLLDLVVVGQHSRPFSAIQNEAGYFTDAGYFASADEYVRVWAPGSFGNLEVMTPPCVYFGMERTEEQARRSDYVGCYDSTLGEWYDLAMPRGPYWTEYSPVTFWDSNGDGRLEFAARRQDGKWALLTLVRD
jgi:hypothetical protein